MKKKQFNCATGDASMTVAPCTDSPRVAVWWTEDEYSTIHMTPGEALRMAKRIKKAAIKQLEKHT